MSPKFLNVLRVQDWRCDIEAAPLRQWEEPLDVVVNTFQLIVRPVLNLAQMATAMVWFRAAVKPYDW
jgi:hypothetical protein